MWIDTHAHLYLDQFAEDRDLMMKRALDAGVEHFFLPDIDKRTTDSLDDLVASYKGHCHPMSGLHPCSVKENYEEELRHVRERLDQGMVAVGEVGLDYYWDTSFVDQQQDAFERQIEWARELDLPIIIHSRDSLDDTIGTIERMSKGDLKGIFHCFNGDLEQMKRIRDVGFLIGLGGVITFKKVLMDDVIMQVDNNGFVLETDAPYLSPVPNRGKRNESAYIPLIGEYIAEVRKTTSEDIARMTSENAMKLFGMH